jgi:hypothetical protein
MQKTIKRVNHCRCFAVDLRLVVYLGVAVLEIPSQY